MADNTTLNAGSGGDSIATEDISGVKYEKVKLIDPTPGSTDPIGIAGSPMSVEVDGVQIVRAATLVASGLDASQVGLTANARAHQMWSPDHFGNAGADGKFYAQQMNILGDLFVALSTAQTASGPVLISWGAGATEAGTLRVTFASDVALPLPSGAATNAAVQALEVAQGSTTSGQSGILALGAVTGAPTYSTGQTQPLNITTNGYLRVAVSTSALPAGAAQDSTLATTNTEIGATNETAPASDTATSGLNGRLQRIAQRLSSLIALVPAALSGSGNFKTAISEAITAGTNNIGQVSPAPQTANGLSAKHFASAATNNATSLKASAGQVYSVWAVNINAAPRYLKFYDKSSSPTPGTDTIKFVVPVPGNTAGAGIVVDTGGMGITMGTGIAYALVTGLADSDNTAPSANEVLCEIFYK